MIVERDRNLARTVVYISDEWLVENDINRRDRPLTVNSLLLRLLQLSSDGMGSKPVFDATNIEVSQVWVDLDGLLTRVRIG